MDDPKIQETVNGIKAKFEKRIQEIKAKGSKKINDITDESPDPSSVEATLDMTFDVKWKITSIKFDIPKFRMERKDIIFDLPSVTMKTKSISWDEPAVQMKRRCFAKKPALKCSGFPPKCTVKMKCMYADFPEVYTKRREIKIDLPEFTMKRQNIAFDVPEVTFETIEIKLNLPQFYLRSLSGDLKDQKNEIEDISGEMQFEIHQAKNEMNSSLLDDVTSQITELFDEIESSLLEERKNVSTNYNEAISKMKTSIKILKENNAKDEVLKLETQLSKLIKDYATILNDLDESLKNLNDQQKEAISGIKLG